MYKEFSRPLEYFIQLLFAKSRSFIAGKYYSGRPVGRLDGEAGNRTSTAQLELELGLSLAIFKVSYSTGPIFQTFDGLFKKTLHRYIFIYVYSKAMPRLFDHYIYLNHFQ